MKVFAALARAAVVAAVLAPGFAFAQAEGDARFDYRGRWTLDYPREWVVDLAGPPVIASFYGTVNAIRTAAPMPVGTLGIGIFPPEDYGLFGAPAGASVADTLAAFVRLYGGTAPAVPLPEVGPDALTLPLLGAARRVSPFAHLIAFERGGIVFSFIVVVEEFAEAVPDLARIFATLAVTAP